MNNLNTLGLLALALLVLVKDVVVPLIKRMNHKNDNPVKLEVFYQEFSDFKKEQCKWNEKIEKRIEKVEEKT